MAATLQIISVDCESHPAIVALITENARALFDAGEGVQRLVVEHKLRVGKMTNIFLTSHMQCSLGGLPGMLLTLHDAGATDIKLTGSRLAREYLSATNVFMRPFNNFTPVEATEPLKCSVDNIEVCAVPITSGDGQVERVCYIGSTPEIAGKFVLEKAVALGVPKGPLFGKLKSGQAVTLPSGSIVHPSEVLDPPEPGRTFIIVPSIGKDENDLLNSLLGSNIISSYRSTGSPSSKQAHKVVHLSKASTIDLPVYQDWVRSFGPDAEHIFIGHGCCEVRSSFLASSLHRYGLYSISSEAFAPQRRLEGEFCSQFLSEAVQSSSLKVVVGRSLLRIGVSPLKKAINEDVLSVCLQSQETTKEEITARIPAIVEKIDSYRRKHSPGTPLVAPLIDFGDDRFIFLGTGCAIPSKYRNVSGILHFMSCSRSGLLMDCGEGTWFQLISICPSVVLPDFQPSSLLMEEQDRTLAWARIVRVVWISHAHADHHLGLITLILERQRSLRRVKEFTPIVIIAPYQVLQFLNHVSANVCKEMAGAYLPVPCHLFDASRVCGSCSVHDDGTGLTDGSTRDTEQQQQQSTYQVAGSTKRMRISRMEGDAFDEEYCRKNLDAVMSILVSVGISQLLNVPVIHCPQAYGLVVERSKGGKTMKIAYSGDTRPSDLFVHFASGATVLIHEATFEDDKLEEAIQKKHSTINEALLVGKQIGAYRTILTHFSQRYHGVPAQLRPSGDEVDIMHVDAISASDFMCLRVADLPWAPILTSALYDLLPPQTDEVEDELEGK